MNHHTEKCELTALCLIYHGDSILLQNRLAEDWQGYALPGGHIEEGESIVGAVIREMKEETGLTIHRPRLCGVKQFPIDGGRYLVFLFKTDEFEGELRSSAEGEMEWVRRSELPRINAVKDFAQLLSVFDDDSLTEFMYVPESGRWNAVVW